MSILRSLIVSKSPNSSVLGLLTHRDQHQEYSNPEYKNNLHGEPLDLEVYFDDPVLKSPLGNVSDVETLTGIFHLFAKDAVDDTTHRATINVLNGVVMVVCSGDSMLWVNPSKCSRELIHSTLRKAMSPSNYEQYMDNERRSFSTMRDF